MSAWVGRTEVALVAWLAVFTTARAGEVAVTVLGPDQQPRSGVWVALQNIPLEKIEIDDIRRWIDGGANGPPDERAMWKCTGPDGRVVLHEPQGLWTDALAIDATCGGRAIVAHGSRDSIELVVRPHRFWDVTVIDPQGPNLSPLPIELRKLNRGTGLNAVLESVMTDEMNRVRFGPMDLWIDPGEVDPVFEARANLLGLYDPTVRWDTQCPPMSSEIVLPPGGTVRLKVECPGHPDLEPTEVTLRISDHEHRPYFKAGAEIESRSAWTRDGVAEFRHIGYGCEFEVAPKEWRFLPRGGEISDLRTVKTRLPALGPGRAEVSVPVFVGPQGFRTVRLHGQVLDEQGSPLRHHRLVVRIHHPGRGMCVGESPEISSDRDGAFSTSLRVYPRMPKDAVLVITGYGGRFEKRSGIWRCCEEIPLSVRTWNGGDLGPLQLDQLPPLVSGRVRMPDGQPVVGLPVTLGNVEGGIWKSDAGPTWWRARMEPASILTDSAGSFVFRGWPVGGDRSLFTTRHGALVKQVVSEGTHDVDWVWNPDRTFRDQPCGRITGSTLVGP